MYPLAFCLLSHNVKQLFLFFFMYGSEGLVYTILCELDHNGIFDFLFKTIKIVLYVFMVIFVIFTLFRRR